MPYYEEHHIGQKFLSPRRTITDAMATLLIDVGGFAGPQFVDEVSANETPLGWRALPGRVVFCLMGGLAERIQEWHTPGAGLLIGADQLKLRSPVKVGDTIQLEAEIIEMRTTRKPEWGLVKHRERLMNQKGDVVCEADIIHLFEHRKKT